MTVPTKNTPEPDEQRAQRPDAIVDDARERHADHARDRVRAGGQRVVVDVADVARGARQRRDDDQEVERGEEARAQACQHERARRRAEELAQRAARDRAHSTSRAAASTPATVPSVRTEKPVDSSGRKQAPVAAADPDAAALEPAHAAVGAHAHDLDVARLTRPHARRGSGAARWRRRARARPRRRAAHRAARPSGSGLAVDRRAARAPSGRRRRATPRRPRCGRAAAVPTEPSNASASPRRSTRVSQREWPAGRPSSSNVCSWRTARRVSSAGSSARGAMAAAYRCG